MLRLRTACIFGSSLIASAVIALPARAQSGGVAEAFYREGQRLLGEGNVHEACAKFAESQRAEPAVGTLVNLASCHEQEGKTASAWGEFTTAAGQAAHANQKDREEFARKRAAALEKQLHRLMIEVATPAPGMEIKLDGTVLGEGALGTAMPLDPGEHEVTVSAPGRKMWSQRIQLGPGAVNARIEVPALEDSGSTKATPGPVPVGSTASSPDAVPSKPGPLRTVGFVALGAGVVGIGVGAVTGLMAMSKHADLQKACGGNTCGSSQESDRQSYYSLGTVSTVATIAGVALAGTGVILVMTSPKAKAASSATLRPIVGPAYLGARGTF